MTHFLADDGEKIYVHVSGAGPSIVMLHGWTASHTEWAMFLHHLMPHHRVFRWDARAHGGHPLHTGSEPSVERLARDLHNLIEHFDLHDLTLVGHSMGALILWQYLRDFGTAGIARLCFIDQSPKLLTTADWPLGIYGDFDAHKAAVFLRDLQEDFPESVMRLIAFGLNERARMDYLANTDAWQKTRAKLNAQAPAPLIRCWQSLTAADYRDVLEKIDRPTLLIHGEQSNFYPIETAHYLAKAIDNAILHIYAGVDHSPHMWQKERFLRDLREFMAA